MTRVPISVVIPAYGRPEYLREALASVAAQTRIPVETIVVDDGTPGDAIRDIAHAFDVRYVRRTNGGVSAARNTGVAAANAPWIAFLDADDRWLPEKLERQYAVVEAHPEVRVVFCDYTFFDVAGRAPRTALAMHGGYRTIVREPLADGVVMLRAGAQAVAREMFLQSSSLVIDRELAQALPYDETMRYCEDYDFALRLFAEVDVACVEQSLTEYRYAGDGLSAHEREIRRGDLALLAHATTTPQRYGAGAAVLLARKHRLLFFQAIAELRAGDRGEAARFAARSLAARPSIKALALLGFAAVGHVPRKREKTRRSGITNA
jgi:glycosyltransferase involved in cell wall biosynthesis